MVLHHAQNAHQELILHLNMMNAFIVLLDIFLKKDLLNAAFAQKEHFHFSTKFVLLVKKELSLKKDIKVVFLVWLDFILMKKIQNAWNVLMDIFL
jgi:hypothetical protein